MKILPVFRADGQTEGQTDRQAGTRTDRYQEANSRLSHFAKAPDDIDDDNNNIIIIMIKKGG